MRKPWTPVARVSEKLTRKEPRVNWESGREEEAMLVSQQDETTREKLQYGGTGSAGISSAGGLRSSGTKGELGESQPKPKDFALGSVRGRLSSGQGR
jgi:hypothetical protein